MAQVFKALLSGVDRREDQQSEVCSDDIPQDDATEDFADDPLEENINHFTNIFDEEEETEEVNMSQHPYNT